MFRAVIVMGLVFSTSPVLASYGDLDTQLVELETETLSLAQPLHLNVATFAASEACPLPLDHIVSVPDFFETREDVTVACLHE